MAAFDLLDSIVIPDEDAPSDLFSNMDMTDGLNEIDTLKLHMACSNPTPDPEKIRLHIDRGAYVNWKNDDGDTAMDIILKTHNHSEKIRDTEVDHSRKIDDEIANFSMVALPILLELVRRGGRVREGALNSLRPSFREAIEAAKSQWACLIEPDGFAEFSLTIDLAKKHGWTHDEASNNCLLCGSQFTLMSRKHHCRVCGILCCNACSSKRLTLAATQDAAHSPKCMDNRACDGCFNKVIFNFHEWKEILAEEKRRHDECLLRAASAVSLKPKPVAEQALLSPPQHRQPDSSSVSSTAPTSPQSPFAAISSAMTETFAAFHERGQKLNELNDSTERLKNAATDYNKMTKELLSAQKKKSFF